MAQTESAIIPGLHYFCDHRCWRCPLSDRCRVPIRMAESPEAIRPAKSAGPAGRVAAVVLASMYVTFEEVTMAVSAASAPVGLLEGRGEAPAAPALDMDEPNVMSTAARSAENDPLVSRAKEYARSSMRVLTGLRSGLARRGDPVATDAADRLEEISLTVASKIYRAVSSALEAGTFTDIQSDANGSAKVALLLIEESRRAWQVLMQPGRAIANGAPARFVKVLEDLESGLHQKFPRAFEFVRPGFDTGAAGDAGARALLAAGALGRN
jgi:hypothetical protein